jgi:hypothetical protein
MAKTLLELAGYVAGGAQPMPPTRLPTSRGSLGVPTGFEPLVTYAHHRMRLEAGWAGSPWAFRLRLMPDLFICLLGHLKAMPLGHLWAARLP